MKRLQRLWKHIHRLVDTASTHLRRYPNEALAVSFLFCMTLLYTQGMRSVKQETASLSSLRGQTSVTTTTIVVGDSLSDVDHGPEVTLPVHFNYLSNNNQTLSIGSPTPILWYTPRSGGNTVAQILGECRGFVMAGAWHGPPREKLEIVFENGVKQITADLTTPDGRYRARDQGLRDIVPTDVVLLSSNLQETSQVFSGSFQAELWAWFRHPIERQISTYFFLQSLPQDHPSFDPRIQVMSLSDWVRSDLHSPNALLGSLLGHPTSGDWNELDLTIAKNLLRQKARIGLLERKTESVQRFLAGRASSASGSRECQERLLDYAWTTKGRYPSIGVKSEAYKLLVQSNRLDMILYEYAQNLFDEQDRRPS